MTSQKNEDVLKKDLENSFGLLLWGLIIYVIVSLIYQSSNSLRKINRFREVESYFVSDCYTVWVRWPKEVPLVSTPTFENTRPITVWADINQENRACQENDGIQVEGLNKSKQDDNEQNDSRESIKLHLDFFDGQELGFLEKENSSPDGSIWLVFDDNAIESRREQLYIYVPLSKDVPDSLALEIKGVVSNSIENQGGRDEFREITSLSVQTSFSAWLFGFADIALGIPTVTLFAALGALVQIFIRRKYTIEQNIKLTEKEREQKVVVFQAEIEKLSKMKEDLGEQVYALSLKAKDLDGNFDEDAGDDGKLEGEYHKLISEFEYCKRKYGGGNLWNKSLRLNIIMMIKKHNNHNSFVEILQKWHKTIDWPPDDALETLEEFFSWYWDEKANVSGVLDTDQLDNVLFALRFLGLESVQLVIEKTMENLGEDTNLDTFEKHWFVEGKAAGRYLLDRLVDASARKANNEEGGKKIASKILEWQKKNPSPPNELSEHYRVWPTQLRFQVSGTSEPRNVWQQPFGPLKAEDDPRLPPSKYGYGDPFSQASDMFYCPSDQNRPWGQDIFLPTSGFYRFGRGKGKTAFIWMGRYQRRYWGEKPAFSVYLSLTGSANKETFWWELENAMGTALISNLVEDPYWLLNAPLKARERIITFLISWAGSFSSLIDTLLDAGFPSDDETILTDTILVATSPEFKRYDHHEFSFLA